MTSRSIARVMGGAGRACGRDGSRGRSVALVRRAICHRSAGQNAREWSIRSAAEARAVRSPRDAARQWILAGLPLLAAVMPLPHSSRARARPCVHAVVLSVAGAVLLVAQPLQLHVVSNDLAGGSRICRAAAGRDLRPCHVRPSQDPTERRILFGFATFLAWASLVQVPFSAPIYFCYVAPWRSSRPSQSAAQPRARPSRVRVAASVLTMFALVSMNRGYVYNLGAVITRSPSTHLLGVESASLRVSPAERFRTAVWSS